MLSQNAEPTASDITFFSTYCFGLFLNLSVVIFCAAGVWRGVWYLQDELSADCELTMEESLWISIALSVAIALSAWVLSPVLGHLKKKYDRHSWWAFFFLVAVETCFVFYASVGVVCSWRGWWLFYDEYLDMDGDFELSAWMSYVIGTATLVVFGAYRCAIAPPAVCFMDHGEDAFALSHATTPKALQLLPGARLQHNKTRVSAGNQLPIDERVFMSFLMILFSCTVIIFGAAGLWRGVWYLSDEYIYPFVDVPPATADDPEPLPIVVGSDKRKSLTVSIAGGSAICAAGHVVAYLIIRLKIKEKVGATILYALELVFHFFLAIGVVSCWRGWWYFFDELLDFPDDDPKASAAFSIGIGYGVGLFFCCAKSILAVPFVCPMDGEPSAFVLGVWSVPPLMRRAFPRHAARWDPNLRLRPPVPGPGRPVDSADSADSADL